MTLTEFLLARIAELEEDAGTIHEYGCATTGALPLPCDCAIPTRVLAECEAKRRIVAITTVTLDFADPTDREAEDAHAVQEALALPYADHPDYDPAWRP